MQQHGWVDVEGLVTLRSAGRRHAAARDDARRGAAAEDHHRWAAQRPASASRPPRFARAWCTTRCSSSRCCCPSGEVVVCHPAQRTPRPVLRFPQLVRHARLRAAPAPAHAAGEAVRARRAPAVRRRAASSSRRWRRPATARPTSSTASCSARARWCSTAAASSTRRRRCSDYTLRAHLLPLAARDRGRPPAHRATTSGAGTPTGSGARRTSARSGRWLRRLLGRRRLNSRTYTRLMRWNARWGLTQRWARWRGRHPESVIQDVDIPIAHAAEFLDFLLREIGIVPVWLCPLRAPAAQAHFTLYPLAPGRLLRQLRLLGHGATAASRTSTAHFNRLVEREVMRLGGIKSLYSDSFFTRDEFDAAYGMQRLRRAEGALRPAPPPARPVREMRAARVRLVSTVTCAICRIALRRGSGRARAQARGCMKARRRAPAACSSDCSASASRVSAALSVATSTPNPASRGHAASRRT